MSSSSAAPTTALVSSPCSSLQLAGLTPTLPPSLCLLLPGIYPYNTLIVTWVSNNLQNEHVRYIGLPLLIAIANASGIAASQIYPSEDKPRYIMGNSISLGMEVVALLGAGFMYLLIKRRNDKRAAMVANGGPSEAEFKYVL